MRIPDDKAALPNISKFYPAREGHAVSGDDQEELIGSGPSVRSHLKDYANRRKNTPSNWMSGK